MGSDLRTTPHSYTDTGMTSRTGTGSARVLTIIGFVCAAIGVFILPIVFGLAAVVLGLVARSKGDPLGTWAAVAGGAAIVIGMALGMWLFAEASNANNT